MTDMALILAPAAVAARHKIARAARGVPAAVRYSLLRQHGTSSQAYSATFQAGLEHFGDERGFLSYKRVGRTALVLSDPLASPENMPDLISRFLKEHPDVRERIADGVYAAKGLKRRVPAVASEEEDPAAVEE